MSFLRIFHSIMLTVVTGYLLIIFEGSANAKAYPPTKTGLEELVAYDSAILPTPYTNKLRKKLSDWEHGIGVKCHHFPNKKPFCFPAAEDVIKDIQAHIFFVDGLVIDSDEWSVRISPPEVAAPDGGIMPNDTPVTLSQIFPKVVSPETLAAKSFNWAATDFGLKIWAIPNGPPRADPDVDKIMDIQIDYAQNADALPGVISISYSLGYYPHGAAHGEFGSYDFNWNVARNRPLEIGDIFDVKSDWKHGLATAILFAFHSENQNYFADASADDIVGDVSDPAKWAVTKAGIRVDTDAYEVGGYANGAPSAVASWTSLEPYLKRGGLVAP